jgi:hypothetical protein
VAEAPARYCSNCEHELSPVDRFCPNCGRAVHQTASVPTPAADVPVPPPQQPGGTAVPPQQVEGIFDNSTSSEVDTYDVSEVTILRRRLGRAALTTKLMGLLTALFIAGEAFVFAALTNTSPSVLTLMILGVLIFCCAVILSRGIRSGRKYAVVVTAIWLVCFACYVPLNLFIIWTSLSGLGRQLAFLETLLSLLIVYFTARGLLAVRDYKRDLRSDPREGEPLRSNPWENAGKMGTHPTFVNKRSTSIYAFLMVVPVILVFAGAVLGTGLIYNANSGGFRDAAETEGYLEGLTLAAAPYFLAIVALYRRARRKALLPASELSRRNPRPIILYLRSFVDDNVTMNARAANGRTLLERPLSVSFEEVVSDHLWRYGPVVAIGKPGGVHDLPPLGAAREYLSDQTWRQVVEQLMAEASTIVLAVGRTEGLMWELNAIIKLGLTRKLVLLLPPVQTSDLRPRWDYLQQHASEAGMELPEDIELERARVVVFPPGRTAYVITADERDDWAYEAALDAAEELIRQWGTSSGSSTERSAAIAVGTALGSPQDDMNVGSTAPGSRSSDYDLSSPLKSFAKVVWRIVVSPAEFFSSIRRRGDFLSPLIFALIWSEISAVGRGILTGDLSTVLYYLILVPIFLTILLLFGAAITHLLVRLFVGSANSGFEATFRIFCFASPLYTLTWMFDWLLPVLVLGVLLLYGLFLTFLGIREMHQTTTFRAALASLFPLGVFLLMMMTPLL